MRLLAHPWRLEHTAAGHTRVSLTADARQQLGDLRFIDLPAVGAVLEVGMPCITLEGSRMVDTFDSPIAGKVVAVNPSLAGLVDQAADQSAYLIEVQEEL